MDDACTEAPRSKVFATRVSPDEAPVLARFCQRKRITGSKALRRWAIDDMLRLQAEFEALSPLD